MEATAEFVRHNMAVFFLPIIFFFISVAWMAIWTVSAVYVYSVGDISRSKYGPYADIEWNDTTRYVWIYHIFGLFWISAFIIGSS